MNEILQKTCSYLKYPFLGCLKQKNHTFLKLFETKKTPFFGVFETKNTLFWGVRNKKKPPNWGVRTGIWNVYIVYIFLLNTFHTIFKYRIHKKSKCMLEVKTIALKILKFCEIQKILIP